MKDRIRYEFVRAPGCDMCGSEKREHLGLRLAGSTGVRPRKASAVAIPVKRCIDCRLIYADPRPLPIDIGDHYSMDPEAYFANGELQEAVTFDNSVLGGVLDFKPGMKVVDVGAGVGRNILAFERAGWDAWGVEPSRTFVDYAVERRGVRRERISNAPFERNTLPDETFDLVSFGAVLEHLPSPSEALRAAVRILKPGGAIYAEVPASNSLLARVFNLYYRLQATPYVTHISPMHPPYHLYEFTRRSFELNGQSLGYSVARHQYWQGAVYNLPLKSVVRNLINKTVLGDGLTVVLKKAT